MRKYKTDEERRLAKNLQSRKYRLENKEKVAAGLKAYRAANHKHLCRYALWNNAKDRSKKKNLEFTLMLDDVCIPEFCPILGMRLESGFSKNRDDSPSIDRIDLTKGYTPDNIQVISYLANRMKNNATSEQLLKFADWIKEKYDVP